VLTKTSPLVGGALAKPNENIPHLVPAFLHGLFDKYPYMLPSMTACLIAVVSFTYTLVFMKEVAISTAYTYHLLTRLPLDAPVKAPQKGPQCQWHLDPALTVWH
jgi:hypothetical protein